MFQVSGAPLPGRAAARSDAGTPSPHRAATVTGELPPTGRRERIDPPHRLRSTRDYAQVKQGGAPLRGRHCVLLVLARPGEPTRFGFVASRRGVGGAVQRNRARRRLREIVRRRWPRIPEHGFWIMVIAARTALTADHQELASEVERLLATAGALHPLGMAGV
jgi:ribonuclease P protein component